MDADFLHEIATKEVWVTPADGHVQGVIVLRREDDHMVVTTSPSTRTRKAWVWGALLEHAERRAADHGVAEVRLLTHELMTENRALYAHLGYSPLPRPPAERLPRVHLGKRLHCK